MKIWVIEIGEPLPIEGDVRLLRYGLLTKAFASFGHEVTWWASSFSHASKKHVCSTDSEITVDNVLLKIIKGPGYNRNISYQRIKHHRHFAKRFELLALPKSKPDIIISPIPTIEASRVALNFAQKYNVPVIIDIRDEWPDELVNLFPKTVRFAGRFLFRKSYRQLDQICRKANAIIAMSQRQLDFGLQFAGRMQGKNDRVFPHGYSSAPVASNKIAEAHHFWDKAGIDRNAFICCFFGTIGQFFNLATVIKSADILSREMNVQFVLCGSGDSLVKYKRMADGIRSVIFPGWIDAPKISALMEISDVGLAPYAANTRMSLPNKPFEYFSGGLPVVSSIQGELTAILDEFNCGITYQADSTDEFCNAIRTLRHNDQQRKKMGENARQLFMQKYSTEAIASEYEIYLQNLTNQFKEIKGRQYE